MNLWTKGNWPMNAVRLAMLWKEKDENGNTYLSGKLNDISGILVMPNTDKKDEEPDYFLYLCQDERGEAWRGETEQQPRRRRLKKCV